VAAPLAVSLEPRGRAPVSLGGQRSASRRAAGVEGDRLRSGPAGRQLAQEATRFGLVKPHHPKRSGGKGVQARVAGPPAQLPGPPRKGSANDWAGGCHQHRPDRRASLPPSVNKIRRWPVVPRLRRTFPSKRSRSGLKARAGSRDQVRSAAGSRLDQHWGWRSWSCPSVVVLPTCDVHGCCPQHAATVPLHSA